MPYRGSSQPTVDVEQRVNQEKEQVEHQQYQPYFHLSTSLPVFRERADKKGALFLLRRKRLML